MKKINLYLRCFLLVLSVTMLAGCQTFRPATEDIHFFVLSSRPPPSNSVSSGSCMAVGLARLEVPDYLRRKQLAWRASNSEILYAGNLHWAEPLEKGLERVLSANVACELGSMGGGVLLAWRPGQVQAEIYISIERFEVDERGDVILEARWRITGSNGARILRAGLFQTAREGGALNLDASRTIAAFDAALAEFSHEIAAALSVAD